MAKREIEVILAGVKHFKAAGLSTFQAMAATMNDREWDDLLELIEKLQNFYREHATPAL